MTQHTIVLLQKTKNPVSRTFSDYETIQLAIESIIELYEQRLKELNPTVRNITYDVKDLHAYIDHMGDVVLLTFDPQIKAYLPYDREWIKQRIFNHFKQVAGVAR